MSKALDLATLVTSDLATQTDLVGYATSSDLTTAIDGVDQALKTKIITGTYSSDSVATITTASLGFEAKHVICRFNLEDVSNAEADYNISFGNATKVDATTSAYACSYNYFNQTGTQQAHDTVTTCMGRLAYGGAQFNNLKVSAWGSDTITLLPERNGTTPVHNLSYQLIIQG